MRLFREVAFRRARPARFVSAMTHRSAERRKRMRWQETERTRGQRRLDGLPGGCAGERSKAFLLVKMSVR